MGEIPKTIPQHSGRSYDVNKVRNNDAGRPELLPDPVSAEECRGRWAGVIHLWLSAPMVQNEDDIVGPVAAMTESDPGVESERASHNAPG